MDLASVIRANKSGSCPVGPTSWYYKNLVPKTLKENLEFRKRVLDLGYENEDYAEELRVICSRDILFEINTFGWTYAIKDFPNNPVRPFITYEQYQDQAILDMQDAIAVGEDVACPKSRDMGASWTGLLAMEHRWRHLDNQSFLIASRTAPMVCKANDMDALLQKIEWYVKQLPLWLQPKKWELLTSSMTLMNHDKHSLFSGEATVDNLATGGRRTAIFLDEVSKMPRADMIFTSTRDVTNCRIFNSTPNGRFGIGEPFYKKCQNKTVRKIFMHWSDNPNKRQGLYYVDSDGKKQKFEDGWSWRNEYDFDLLTFKGRKPRSTWYDRECAREDFRERKIAQELDINFIGSGQTFISAELISQWITKYCEDGPHAWGMLLVDGDDLSATWQGMRNEDAPFKLWLDLDHRGKPPQGSYVVGADISAGTGGEYSSNSSLVIFDDKTKEQVGRFASKKIKADDFGRFAVAVCKWFHDALLVPEANGGTGSLFITAALEAEYWNIYRHKKEFVATEVINEKLGYFNNDGGLFLLESLVSGIERGRVIIRDEEIYKEMAQYEWDTTGRRICHSGTKTRTDDGDKGLAHGDMAIAAGCGYLGMRGDAAFDNSDEPEDEIPNYDCAAKRFRDWEDQQIREGQEEQWAL